MFDQDVLLEKIALMKEAELIARYNDSVKLSCGLIYFGNHCHRGNLTVSERLS